MEGFSMPLSNKGTAGLPNPHPVGLQSFCSILLGSLPLGLCQATALHQTHTRWATRPSVVPASSCQTHTMPEYPSHDHGDPPHHSMLDPIPELVPQLMGMPAPSPELTALQALLSPSNAWDDQTPPLGLSLPIRPCWAPAPCGMTGALLPGTGTSLA
jgi:hypothetical protein